MTDHVLVSKSGRVSRIEMSRPEKKNALTRAMYTALSDAIDAAEADPAVRVVTLSGAGGVFTSGNDLKDFLEGRESGPNTPVMRFLRTIAHARKPLIAGVEGLAVGVGVTMLLHCDLVYAAEGTIFQMPFVGLGVVPEAASSLLLPRLVGHQRACELLLYGDRFDARSAFELKLINAIHPRADLGRVVAERAEALAAKPPQALLATKELLKGEAYRSEVSARIEEERVLFERQLASPEAREAMSAFLEKRPVDLSRTS